MQWPNKYHTPKSLYRNGSGEGGRREEDAGPAAGGEGKLKRKLKCLIDKSSGGRSNGALLASYYFQPIKAP